MTKQGAPLRRLPGETGIWVLVGGDLVVFSVFFVLLALQRLHDAAAFAASQRSLNQFIGALNTFLLLTSSLCVALAIRRLRANPSTPFAPRAFAAAASLGLGFVGVKAFEWSERFAAGQSVSTNDFFMYYFMYTGIHLLHVIVGLIMLTLIVRASRRPILSAAHVSLIEAGGVFWHLVDLLWLVLFALFYLMK